MLDTYTQYYPPNIIFGFDTIKSLPELLPANSKVLLVTGRHLETSGELDPILNSLANFAVTKGGFISPEVPLSDVDSLLELGRRENVTAVVGVGGGSVLDAAKAAAALIPKEGNTADYFYGKRDINTKGLFQIAAPSTAGTGTEITKNAVLKDPATRIKKSIRHPSMVPDVAIVDPGLTLSCPAELTADSGMDALTQAIESFTSRKAHTVSKILARAAVTKLVEYLELAYCEPMNRQARSEVAEGSFLSGMAFSNSGLGAVHGLAHPMGVSLKLSHGKICAILLPHILKLNLFSCRDEIAELALACGLANADQFIVRIEELGKNLNIPANLAEFGLKEDDFPFILKQCRSSSMQCNPREMSDEDILNLLKNLG